MQLSLYYQLVTHTNTNKPINNIIQQETKSLLNTKPLDHGNKTK